MTNQQHVLALALSLTLGACAAPCSRSFADGVAGIVPLFDQHTQLEPATQQETKLGLVTRIGDRVRDRHARESQFKAYDHYLSFYWEQRTVAIELVDRVAKGGKEILVTIRSQSPLNDPNFRCFFRGLNTVAEYHENMIATETDTNTYSVTITHHPVEKRDLRIGDRIEFEFSPFLASPKHGRSNYYGTTMLYVVGKGVVPWMGIGKNLDSRPLPKSALLGGGTTLSYQYSEEPAERFKQMAGNLSPRNAQPFLLGRRIHHTNMLDGAHSEQPNPAFQDHVGKLGPRFVAHSCIECHVNNGRALPPEIGEPMYQTVVKVGADLLGSPHGDYGTALQPRSTEGKSEGVARIAEYEKTSGSYGDGDEYELRKPVYHFEPVSPEHYSVRLTPQLVGLGLLEAIAEADILAIADADDRDKDGISGRPQVVIDVQTQQPRLGRFGYKAGQARLSHQIAAALHSDMGVDNPIAHGQAADASGVGEPEVSSQDLELLETYVSLLGVNARRGVDDPGVRRGEALFNKANCAACHTPTFTTSDYHPKAELRSQRISPYTDLLLHDMGKGLADSLREHHASAVEWRTAPLWGIGLTAGVSGGRGYLHDGRARTLEEAILWHGGEAEESKESFRTMSRGDRADLIQFLESL